MSTIREFVGVPPQADSMTLDRLNTILNKAGIADHEIIAGAEFTHAGYQKLARMMGYSLKDIQMVINELMEKLRSEHHDMSEAYEEVLDEDDERYSYEADFLGNVTIRDNESGNEEFVQGSEASSLMNALGSGLADKQELLAHYMQQPVNEDVDPEAVDVGDDTYEDEIESKRGTYNFPWKSGAGHGTATAEYSGKSKISVVSVRDSKGDAVKMSPDLAADLHRQAVEFIGDA